MEQVLERLKKGKFQSKSTQKMLVWWIKIDFLGYEITRDGIQPQPMEVEDILKLSPPNKTHQLRHFLDMIRGKRVVTRWLH
jgi:hypothetical protein